MRPDDLSLLLSINEAIATTQDRVGLFHIIFSKLRDSFKFKVAGLELLSKNKLNMEVFLKGVENIFSKELPFEINEKLPISLTPFEISFTNPVIKRIKVDEVERNPENRILEKMLETMSKFSIYEVIHCPLQSGGEIIGYLVLAFKQEDVISESDMVFLQLISNQVAILMSVTIAYAEIAQREKVKEIQLSLTNSLVNIKEREELFRILSQGIDQFIGISYLGINVKNPSTNESITMCYVKEPNRKFKIFPVNKTRDIPFLILKSHLSPEAAENFYDFNAEEFNWLCQQSSHFRYLKEKLNVCSILFVNDCQTDDGEINLILSKDGSSEFKFMPPMKDAKCFSDPEIEFILKLLTQLAMVMKNFFAYEEISYLKKQLEQEKNYLLDEINLANNFQEIIGNSIEIQSVLNKVTQVAPLDATVLIQGETGTGKELIARAIHNLSDRKDKPLVKLNCTALPTQLIESELFGHERGSFTGAVERRIGKFELANSGTIFLDEIGELPLELQAKLLRVLQEQEFERIGGKQTIKIDVRVIAATNRDLENEVKKGNFRPDLFFRLNVFPIALPPLRKRIDDIPLFVKYFSEKYAKKVGKPIKSIRRSDLEMLKQYEWPGNIRELEHLIERAVIVSNTPNLELSEIMSGKGDKPSIDIHDFKPLELVEKEYIMAALRATNGRVTGEKGAAKLLGINGKTLGSKMRKFGIKKEITILT